MEIALRLHDATIRQVLAKHSGYEADVDPPGRRRLWWLKDQEQTWLKY